MKNVGLKVKDGDGDIRMERGGCLVRQEKIGDCSLLDFQ